MNDDELKLNAILLRIFAVLDIVFFILFFTAMLLSHNVTGTSLTDYYIDDLRLYYIFSSIKGGMLGAFLFSLTASVILFLPLGFADFRENTSTMKTMFAIFICIMFIVMFVAIPVNRAIPAIFNKPVIKTVTVINMERHYGGSRNHRHWVYTLYFSNGVTRNVSESKYSAASIGGGFYLVMCGHEPIGVYPTSEYTIPASSTYRE